VQGIVRAATRTLPQTWVLSPRTPKSVWRERHGALMRSRTALSTLILTCVPIVGWLLSSGLWAAPNAELAKKCAALTAKAFPARVAGNPAAGSAKGGGRAEQDYFNDCVKKEGNIEPLTASEGAPVQSVPIPTPRP
jgi:hypothetical protein